MPNKPPTSEEKVVKHLYILLEFWLKIRIQTRDKDWLVWLSEKKKKNIPLNIKNKYLISIGIVAEILLSIFVLTIWP